MTERPSTGGGAPADKAGETSDPSHTQPEAAEVESARLLENDARGPLRDAGYSDERIRELADEYIALGVGEDPGAFVDWARDRGPSA